MILSHSLELIFVKTKKVGGTSFEIALSKYCSDDCIIAPISPKDEDTRAQLGFAGPRNHLEAERMGRGVAGHPNCDIRGDFYNHMPSSEIRAQVGDDLFSRYTTISITRNPLDFLISQYFFRISFAKRQPPSFRDWYFDNKENVNENPQIAPSQGPDACDVILRYEHLQDDIDKADCLPNDFWSVFSSIGAKGNYRAPESQDARKYFEQQGLSDEIPGLLSGIRA